MGSNPGSVSRELRGLPSPRPSLSLSISIGETGPRCLPSRAPPVAHKAQRARGTAPGTSGAEARRPVDHDPPVPPHSRLRRPGTPGPARPSPSSAPGPPPRSQSVPGPCPGLKSGLVLQGGCQLALEQNPGRGASPYRVSAASSVTWGHGSCPPRAAARTAVQKRALGHPSASKTSPRVPTHSGAPAHCGDSAAPLPGPGQRGR